MDRDNNTVAEHSARKSQEVDEDQCMQEPSACNVEALSSETVHLLFIWD